MIQVPVVVTDKSGNHLHGLNKEDFAILENGRPVSVTHFEELTASTTQLKSPAVPVGQFRNLALNDRQPRNIVVIALDTVNTPFLDQAYGRRELVKFLARNMESGKVLALMLITTRGLRVVQGLTGDSTHLMQALNKVAGEISPIETMSSDAQESLTGACLQCSGRRETSMPQTQSSADSANSYATVMRSRHNSCSRMPLKPQ